MAEPRVRNADWSRDETILLLDLYLRHPKAEARHPEVAALSRSLRELAASTGAPRAANFRNPVGIAMKLRNLAQQDPAFQRSGRAGLGHGNRLNAEVWALLADDPPALAAEVARIRLGAVGTQDAPQARSPSRGPPPSFGSFQADRSDGPTEVYVLILQGADRWTAGSPSVPAGHDVLKVGLSNDVGRRTGELNAGLPGVLGVRWARRWSTPLPTASDAYSVEQSVLRAVGERGWSDGGEFVVAPAETLIEAIRASLPAGPSGPELAAPAPKRTPASPASSASGTATQSPTT